MIVGLVTSLFYIDIFYFKRLIKNVKEKENATNIIDLCVSFDLKIRNNLDDEVVESNICLRYVVFSI